MWVSFNLLVIRPAKGLDVCQAILEDDGCRISFQCLQSLLAANFDQFVIYPPIWPGEWMEFPLPRKAYSLNMPMTLPCLVSSKEAAVTTSSPVSS